MFSDAISIHNATFRNSFVRELPGEITNNNHSRQVPGYCYSTVRPTPVSNPRLLGWSEDMAEFLGVQRPDASGPDVNLLAGNLVTPSMNPFAARYGGHQFGHWAGQLGDGRAISIGELKARDNSFWEIQLKGAGPTPYSRTADGRAVLRSSLREFLCSEAMFHLGVPTSRALSLVETGDLVKRDMFYSGDIKAEKGAIVARVAPTFIRFGNFELFTERGEISNLTLLADYVIRHHFPQFGAPSPEVYSLWFEEICKRTAHMIAQWMTMGFVHGVMNTDNMSILGLTIDYGPYGWLEPFDPRWTPNTTDFSHRRYGFGQQPRVALWNLAMLAQALAPLVPKVESLERGLQAYSATFSETYHKTIAQKLGFPMVSGEDHSEIVSTLLASMEHSKVDMTLFFRALTNISPEILEDKTNHMERFATMLASVSYSPDQKDLHQPFLDWLSGYAAKLQSFHDPAHAVKDRMIKVNPKFVLRNYLAQQAIEGAEVGDLTFLNRLMFTLSKPFEEQPDNEDLAQKRPVWAADKAGCATLSCSS